MPDGFNWDSLGAPVVEDDEGARQKATFERNKAWTKADAKDFTTKLTPYSEGKFREWVKANNIPFDPDSQTADYDMRGFWQESQDPADWKALQKAGKISPDMAPAGTKIDPNDGKPHYPDYWKTPYHESFSNQSQWADPAKAPTWNDKDQLVGRDGKVVFDDKAQKPAGGLDWDSLGMPVDARQHAPSTISPADAAMPFQTPPGFYRGQVLPFMADDKGNTVLGTYNTPFGSFQAPELFTPGFIASPLRGAVAGGQEALGQRPVDDPSVRGDITNAAMFGARPAPGEIATMRVQPEPPLRMGLNDDPNAPPGGTPAGGPARPSGGPRVEPTTGNPTPGGPGAASELNDLQAEIRQWEEQQKAGTAAPAAAEPAAAGPATSEPAAAAPEAPAPVPPSQAALKRGDAVTVTNPARGGEISGTVFGVRPDGKVWVTHGGRQELYERDPATDQLHAVEREAPPEPKTEAAPEKPDSPVAKADVKPGHVVTFMDENGEHVTGKLVGTREDGQHVVDLGSDGSGARIFVKPDQLVAARTPKAEPEAKLEPETPKAAAKPEEPTEKAGTATAEAEKPAADLPTAEQPVAKVEPKPEEAENAHGGPWTKAGQNAEGETVYTNPNGVHATFVDGVPWAEATTATGAPADPDNRKPRHQVVADKTPQNPATSSDAGVQAPDSGSPQEPPKNTETAAKPAEQSTDSQPAGQDGQEVEYTTKKGRVLKGTVRTDLDAEGARAIDPYAIPYPGGGWFIRSQPKAQKPKADAAKPKAAEAGDRWTEIGTNHNDHPVYEDKNGVRSYVESGIRSTENVQVGPRGSSVPAPADKHPDYQVASWHPTQAHRGDPEYQKPGEEPAAEPKQEDAAPAEPKADEPKQEAEPKAEPKPNAFEAGADLRPGHMVEMPGGVFKVKATKPLPDGSIEVRFEGNPKPQIVRPDTLVRVRPDLGQPEPKAEKKPAAPKAIEPKKHPVDDWVKKVADAYARGGGKEAGEKIHQIGIENPSFQGDEFVDFIKKADEAMRAVDAAKAAKPEPKAPTKPKAEAEAKPARGMNETAFRNSIRNTGAAQHDGQWRIVPLPFVPDRFAVEYTPGAGSKNAGERIVHGAPEGQDSWTLEQAQEAAAQIAGKLRPFDPKTAAPRPAAEPGDAKVPPAAAAPPPPPAPTKSWAPEVFVEGKWSRNGLRFATREEAEASARELWSRWMMASDSRATEADEPVNYRWDKEEGLVAVDAAPPETAEPPAAPPEPAGPFPATGSATDPLLVNNLERLREEYGPDGLLARMIAQILHERDQMPRDQDRTIRFPRLQQVAEQVYGGTLADNAFARDRLYDALESGVNFFIAAQPARFAPTGDLDNAKAVAADLEDIKSLLPTQTVRAGDKDTLQQFSTPPDYAFAAAWVANLTPGDRVLEPSAGTGGLAVHAMTAGVSEVVGNEISEQRRTMMANLPFSRITGENAEQLNNILADNISPTVVIMNPPFSSAGERMGGKMVLGIGATHIEQALKRLQPGGRLVAIVGRGMSMEAPTFRDWWKKMRADYDIRANIQVGGGIYRKYGTTFATRLLVFDKVSPSGRPVVEGDVTSADALLDLLSGVRDDRPEGSFGQSVAGQPSSAPLAQGNGPAGQPATAVSNPVGGVRPGSGSGDAAGTDSTKPADGGGGQPTGIQPPGVGGVAGNAGNAAPVQQPKSDAAGGNGKPGSKPSGSKQPRGSGGGGASGAIRPDGGDLPVTTPQLGAGDHTRPDGSDVRNTPPGPELVETGIIVPDQEHGGELTESVYESYTPQRIDIEGAQPHPGALVQSAAMASVLPPIPNYNTSIPKELIASGALSNAQLEAIIYAGNAHQHMLPKDYDGIERRRGFFIGDGTGVGKGREVAGIILDNRRQGRKKAVWVSEKLPLSNDAKRDWTGLGGKAEDILPHNKVKAGDAIKHNGILFTSYDTLKSGEKQAPGDDEQPMKVGDRVPKSRVQQIVDWLGADFDGVIAFDESHNMGNAVATKGTRGTKQAAAKALAGLELQKALPNARVVYVSATGATEVSNLAYADRLGLWGPGTAFPTRDDFRSKVASGGVAAMELVARDMKALGLYMARSLSYDGVEYDRILHPLEPLQHQMYDQIADAWQIVLQNFMAALETTEADGKGGPKSGVLSAFWGGHQRFFNQLITSLQMPSVLENVEKDIAAGRQAVLQLVNTNEAGQERALEKNRANGEEDLEDLDMSPRDQLMQLVDKAFPTQQYEEYADAEGNIRVRPVKDSEGHPVHNKEAIAAKEKLLDDLGSLRVPDGPLEILMNHFGADAVAEVTGRKQRVVKALDPDTGRMKTVLEKRGNDTNIVEAKAFQDGKKKILVFSQAGGTGRSYHAELSAPSANARRSHYLVQAGWRADTAVQGFGRTHRTNQASAPIFHLVTTDLEGQKRFISSIARRLGQLGALTKGERRTGDQGMFGLQDNLESDEAKAGLTQLYRDIYVGDVEGITVDTIQKQMGLKLVDEATGMLRSDLPPMTQFLNRILSLKVNDQNHVFGEFAKRFRDIVDRAAADGTLDAGTETYRADKITKKREQVVYTDPNSGAETRHVHLETYTLNHPVDFATTNGGRSSLTGRQAPLFYVQNERSGNISAVSETTFAKVEPNGMVTLHYRVSTPLDYRYVPQGGMDEALRKGTMHRIDSPSQAQRLWDKRVAETPEFQKSDLHMITGAVLPIWDRLGGQPKIYRLQTDAGERLLGRVVENKVIAETLHRLGAEGVKIDATPAEVIAKILDGAVATLANGWEIKRSRVASEWRLELKGGDLWPHAGELAADGVFRERIAYDTRYFIPSGDNGPAVIEAITRRRPITALTDNAPPGGLAEGTSIPLYSAVQRAADGLKQAKGTGEQMLSMLSKTPGVKPEEMEWLGLPDWLRGQKTVTQEQIQDYVRANALDVREVVRGDDIGGDPRFHVVDQAGNQRGDFDTQAMAEAYLANPPSFIDPSRSRIVATQMPFNPTQFASYKLEGGEAYREMLITLPHKPNLPPKPETVSDLPAGYGTVLDRMAPASSRWLVVPPGQQHGRPFAGLHDSEETAVRFAVLKINADAIARWRGEVDRAGKEGAYQSGHWNEPNVVAHVRFDEREALDGARVLMVQEVQSDWHQAGRKKGYKGPKPRGAGNFFDWTERHGITHQEASDIWNGRMGDDTPAQADIYERWEKESNAAIEAIDQWNRAVPEAPFKTSWPALVMKRMIKYAVDHGFDRVAWSPGAVHSARYNLGEHISEIEYEPVMDDDGNPADLYEVKAYSTTNRVVLHEDEVPLSRIEELVGSEIAGKIKRGEGEHTGGAYRGWRTLSGVDLKVGGDGMQGFYDQILPKEVGKIVGKYGAKVGRGEIEHDNPDYDTADYEGTRNTSDPVIRSPVHQFDITPALRDAVQSDGLALFDSLAGRGVPGVPGVPGMPARRPASAPQVSRWVAGGGVNFRDLLPTAPLAGHDDAADWVLERGRATGHEHLAVVDNKTGQIVHAGTNGETNAVGFAHSNTAGEYAAYTMHHNHPSSSAISDVDIQILANPGISHVLAHSHDGTTTRASLGPSLIKPMARTAARIAENRKALIDARNAVTKSAAEVLMFAMDKGQLTKAEACQYYNDVVNRLLHAWGVIDYVSGVHLPDPIRAGLRSKLKNLGLTDDVADRNTKSVLASQRNAGLPQAERATRVQERPDLAGGGGQSQGDAVWFGRKGLGLREEKDPLDFAKPPRKPVAEVRSDQIVPPGTPGRLQTIRQWGKDNLRQQKVRSEALGADVTINYRGIKKAADGAGDDILSAFPAIPDLIARGDRLAPPQPPKDPAEAKSTRAWHLLGGVVRIDGREVSMFVNIREDVAGNYFYNLGSAEGGVGLPTKAGPIVPGGTAVSGRGPAPDGDLGTDPTKNKPGAGGLGERTNALNAFGKAGGQSLSRIGQSSPDFGQSRNALARK